MEAWPFYLCSEIRILFLKVFLRMETYAYPKRMQSSFSNPHVDSVLASGQTPMTTAQLHLLAVRVPGSGTCASSWPQLRVPGKPGCWRVTKLHVDWPGQPAEGNGDWASRGPGEISTAWPPARQPLTPGVPSKEPEALRILMGKQSSWEAGTSEEII